MLSFSFLFFMLPNFVFLFLFLFFLLTKMKSMFLSLGDSASLSLYLSLSLPSRCFNLDEPFILRFLSRLWFFFRWIFVYFWFSIFLVYFTFQSNFWQVVKYLKELEREELLNVCVIIVVVLSGALDWFFKRMFLFQRLSFVDLGSSACYDRIDV